MENLYCRNYHLLSDRNKILHMARQLSCAKFCNDQLIGIWIRIKRNPSNFNFCGKIVSETDPWSAISECHPGWDSFWQRWYCDNRGYETILIRIGQAMQGETCAMFWIYSLKKYMLNLYHRLVAPSLEKLACTLHIFLTQNALIKVSDVKPWKWCSKGLIRMFICHLFSVFLGGVGCRDIGNLLASFIPNVERTVRKNHIGGYFQKKIFES